MENDTVAVKLLEEVGKTMAMQLMPTQSYPASVGQINNEQGNRSVTNVGSILSCCGLSLNT